MRAGLRFFSLCAFVAAAKRGLSSRSAGETLSGAQTDGTNDTSASNNSDRKKDKKKWILYPSGRQAKEKETGRKVPPPPGRSHAITATMVIKPCHNLGFRANYHQWAPVGTSGAPVGTGVGSRWARIFRLGVYDRRSERWNIVKRRRRKRNRQETGTWGWGGAIVIRRCIYFGFRKSERRRKWTGDGPRLRVGSRVGHMLDAWGVVKSYSNDLTDDLPFWLLALVCVGVDGSSQDMAGIVRDVAEKLGNLQESSEIVRHVEESSGIVKESSGIVKDGFCR